MKQLQFKERYFDTQQLFISILYYLLNIIYKYKCLLFKRLFYS